MKKFFGFGSSTPPPPSPPSKPPTPPAKAAPPPTAAAQAVGGGQPSIVGRWKDPNSSDTTEFHADGTVTEQTGSGQTIRGRYALREKQLKVNLEGVRDELSFPIAIGTDSLEMTDVDGKVTLYRRIG